MSEAQTQKKFDKERNMKTAALLFTLMLTTISYAQENYTVRIGAVAWLIASQGDAITNLSRLGFTDVPDGVDLRYYGFGRGMSLLAANGCISIFNETFLDKKGIACSGSPQGHKATIVNFSQDMHGIGVLHNHAELAIQLLDAQGNEIYNTYDPDNAFFGQFTGVLAGPGAMPFRTAVLYPISDEPVTVIDDMWFLYAQPFEKRALVCVYLTDDYPAGGASVSLSQGGLWNPLNITKIVTPPSPCVEIKGFRTGPGKIKIDYDSLP